MNEQSITLPFDVELPPVTKLRAGTIRCLYERGNLRTIRIGNVEIIRMIYAAVRDQNWATAPYRILDEKIETTDLAFSISYTAFYELGDIRYKAGFGITGTADNTITFNMRGEALSRFERNRIGLCVLHPINECAGTEAVVVKADGSSYKIPFPKQISPHQPFLDIEQLRYRIAGFEVALWFEGAIFETEDQRNWTDSSYKTYSTPLRLPFPVTVSTGEVLTQHIFLQVAAHNDTEPAEIQTSTEIREQRIPVPLIGFSRTPGSALLNADEIAYLKMLPFHHYRITLDLCNEAWKEELEHAAEEAQHLEVLLELVVFFSDGTNNEMDALIAQVVKVSTPLFSILILHKAAKATPQALMQLCYPVLKQQYSNVLVGWGTDGNFAELNRVRPAETLHDFVSFALYPQVHASDIRSIIENLETQHHTLETIETFSDQPVHLSPVTFAGRHVQAADARQKTAFAAWWTLKTLHNLSGARSITFYEITGPNGLLQRDENMHALKSTPVFDVFKKLKAFRPVWIIQKVGAHPLHGPIIFENREGTRLQFALADMGF